MYLFLPFQGNFGYFLPSFQLSHEVRLPLPFVSCRSFRYLLPFASTLLSCSSCSSFPFNSSISLPPSFRCNLSLPFVTPFLSFQCFPPVRLPLPFASSRSFHFILPSVSTRTSCHGRLEKLEWLQVAAHGSVLNFNYRAFCNNVTVSNPALVRLPPWNPRKIKYGSDGLGASQYSFHWQQGSPHIPEPTNTASSRFLLVGRIATCNYKLYIYYISRLWASVRNFFWQRGLFGMW